MPGFTLAPGADATAIAAAQALLEGDLGDVPGDLADRVMIVLGEIVANAVEHGSTSFTVSWSIAKEQIWLDVLGPGPDAALICAATLPANDALRGRGLFLIQSLATSIDSIAGGLRLRFHSDHND